MSVEENFPAFPKMWVHSFRAPHLPAVHWQAEAGHVPGLDGLRCFSIAIVLLGHFVLPTALLGVSAFGVKVFFFISGFLISRLMFAEFKRYASIDLPAFYTRRVLRLYPVLIVYVVLVTSIIYFNSGQFFPSEIASVFLYFVNYLEVYTSMSGTPLHYPIGVLWSLSVEEHFYLVAPVAFVLLKANPRSILIFCVSVCVVCLGVRLAYAHVWPHLVDTQLIYKHSETRVDSIAFGVILSCMAELPTGRRIIASLCTKKAFLIGCFVLLVSFGIRDNYFQNVYRFTVQGVALIPIFCGVIFSAPFPFVNSLLNVRFVTWLGMLSYSMYVWHGGVNLLFGNFLHLWGPLTVGYWEVALAFALAVVSYYVVERPVLRIRSNMARKPRMPVHPAR